MRWLTPTRSTPWIHRPCLDTHFCRLVAFYEQLQPQDLDRLGQLYTEDCRFKDPFNEVQASRRVRRIFAHMFEALDARASSCARRSRKATRLS